MIYNIRPYQLGSGEPSLRNYREIYTYEFVRDDNSVINFTGGYIDTQTKKLVQTISKNVMTNSSGNTKFSNKAGTSVVDMFYFNLSTAAIGNSGPENVPDYLCTIGPISSMVGADYAQYEYGLTIYSTNTSFQPRWFFDHSYEIDTVAKINKWLSDMYNAGTPLAFTYFRKNPVTFNLTDSELKRFLYQIGVQDNFENGAGLLNNLMYQAQGRGPYNPPVVVPPVGLRKMNSLNNPVIIQPVTPVTPVTDNILMEDENNALE